MEQLTPSHWRRANSTGAAATGKPAELSRGVVAGCSRLPLARVPRARQLLETISLPVEDSRHYSGFRSTWLREHFSNCGANSLSPTVGVSDFLDSLR